MCNKGFLEKQLRDFPELRQPDKHNSLTTHIIMKVKLHTSYLHVILVHFLVPAH